MINIKRTYRNYKLYTYLLKISHVKNYTKQRYDLQKSFLVDMVFINRKEIAFN